MKCCVFRHETVLSLLVVYNDYIWSMVQMNMLHLTSCIYIYNTSTLKHLISIEKLGARGVQNNFNRGYWGYSWKFLGGNLDLCWRHTVDIREKKKNLARTSIWTQLEKDHGMKNECWVFISPSPCNFQLQFTLALRHPRKFDGRSWQQCWGSLRWCPGHLRGHIPSTSISSVAATRHHWS